MKKAAETPHHGRKKWVIAGVVVLLLVMLYLVRGFLAWSTHFYQHSGIWVWPNQIEYRYDSSAGLAGPTTDREVLMIVRAGNKEARKAESEWKPISEMSEHLSQQIYGEQFRRYFTYRIHTDEGLEYKEFFPEISQGYYFFRESVKDAKEEAVTLNGLSASYTLVLYDKEEQIFYYWWQR